MGETHPRLFDDVPYPSPPEITQNVSPHLPFSISQVGMLNAGIIPFRPMEEMKLSRPSPWFLERPVEFWPKISPAPLLPLIDERILQSLIF